MIIANFSLESKWQKSTQLSRTLLSILADLNDAIVWMVSILPLISNSSSSFSTPLGPFQLHHNSYHRHSHVSQFFFSSLVRSKYFRFLLFSLPGPHEQQNLRDGKLFFFLSIETSSGRDQAIILHLRFPETLWVSFARIGSGLCRCHLHMHMIQF